MAAFLNLGNDITPEVLQQLNYFAADTTERIMRHIERLDIKHTGALKSSIHSIVYNNAGGDDALVEFYYLNYARYIQYGLGAYFGVDSDLVDQRTGRRTGVKSMNVDVPAISGKDYSAIVPMLSGLPTRNFKGKDRAEWHKAKPFLDTEIRRQLKRRQMKLATRLGFTATAYILHNFIKAMYVSASQAGEHEDKMFSSAMSERELWWQNKGWLRDEAYRGAGIRLPEKWNFEQ